MRTYELPTVVVPEGFIPPDASLPWRPLARTDEGYPVLEARHLQSGHVLVGCNGGLAPVLSRSATQATGLDYSFHPTVRVEVEWGTLIFRFDEEVSVVSQ